MCLNVARDLTPKTIWCQSTFPVKCCQMIVSSYFNKPQHNVVKRQKDHDLVSDSFCYWWDKYFLFADITYNWTNWTHCSRLPRDRNYHSCLSCWWFTMLQQLCQKWEWQNWLIAMTSPWQSRSVLICVFSSQHLIQIATCGLRKLLGCSFC